MRLTNIVKTIYIKVLQVSESLVYTLKDFLKYDQVKSLIMDCMFVAMNMYLAFGLSSVYDQHERRLGYPLAS